jgi:hypothetical protein
VAYSQILSCGELAKSWRLPPDGPRLTLTFERENISLKLLRAAGLFCSRTNNSPVGRGDVRLDFEELNVAVETEAWERPEAHRLMTHPGVGPITALAFVLINRCPMVEQECALVEKDTIRNSKLGQYRSSPC